MLSKLFYLILPFVVSVALAPKLMKIGMKTNNSAKSAVTKYAITMHLKNISNSLYVNFVETKEFPSDISYFIRNMTEPKKGKDPALDDWGHPIKLYVDEKNQAFFEVYSMGPDGKDVTDDDIVVTTDLK